jgi:ABC-type transport system substrate-binding protein
MTRREGVSRKARLCLAVVALAPGAGVLAAATLHGGDAGAAIRRGGTFRVAFFVQPGGIGSIDPALPATPWKTRLLRPACAQLLAFPGPRPELAVGYPKISPDRRTYTFRIKQDVFFNTGERVTARSFARAIERFFSPEMRLVTAITAEDAGLFVGGREFFAGRAQTIRGVEARGNTLRLRLTTPFPGLLDDLAGRPFCAVPANLPIDPEGRGAPLPSAGPYYVARYVPGRLVILLRNRRYRGPRRQHIDSFRIDLANTPSTAVGQVTSGRADLAVPFSPQYDELAARYGVNRSRFFLFTDGTVIQMLILNTQRPLFRNNARLRRAVSFALDRRALIRAVSAHFGSPADQFFSTGVAGFRDAEIYPDRGDLSRARRLARGRTRSGKAVFYVPDVSENIAQAQLVRRYLRPIGIEVEIQAFPQRVNADRLGRPREPFDIGLIRWELRHPSPGQLSCWFHGRNIPTATGGCNLSRFNSPYYNRSLGRAERLVGPPSFRLLGRLDVALARDAAPAIPITHPARAVIVSRRAGCHSFKRPLFDLAAVCLKR